MAPVTNQAAAKTKARRNISRHGVHPIERSRWCAVRVVLPRRGSGKLSGKPRTRLSAAQTSNVSRQSNEPLSQVVRGQLTVDAKPAINVMPVIGPRAWRP